MIKQGGNFGIRHKVHGGVVMTLASIAILGICSLAQGAVTFTKDIVIASGAEVGIGDVKINVVNGDVDIAYKNASNQVVYRSYQVGVGVSDAEIVNPSEYCFWIGGIGRGGADGDLNNKKIKIGYCQYYNLIQSSRDVKGTEWVQLDTGYDGCGVMASGAYAVNPLTGLGGFVSRASDNSAFYLAETSEGVWGNPESFLDANSGGTYPDLVYGGDGVPTLGVNYGKRDGEGPAPWAGLPDNPQRVYTSTAYNYFHSALAEHNGTRYFVSARTTAETRLFYTDAQGNWIHDSLITPSGYSGDKLDYAMDVGPSGQIAVVLPDKRTGDDVTRLYLATKGGLGSEFSWDFTPLTTTWPQYEYPDVNYDDAGNLYVVYYDPADDAIHLKMTFFDGIGGKALE